MSLCVLCSLLGAGVPLARADSGEVTSEWSGAEFGQVSWLFDYEDAVAIAQWKKLPLFVLLLEVPGSPTSVAFGQDVLSHPLVREAVESLFVPVAIFNELDAKAKRLRKSFGERAFGDAVVHIVDANRIPLAKHLTDDHSLAGLVKGITDALAAGGYDVPVYLQLLHEETAARSCETKRAVLQTHCFWEGESVLGRIPGVISTAPGFIESREVVEVEYDPSAVSLSSIYLAARSQNGANGVIARHDAEVPGAANVFGDSVLRSDQAIRPDKDPKYYLAQTPYRHLPMTSLQAVRINAAIHRQQNPRVFLSPKQNSLLTLIEKFPTLGWPEAIGKTDLVEAWKAAKNTMKKISWKR